jgi:peptidoglycan/LPS O-acetylase OafA/YrhL
MSDLAAGITAAFRQDEIVAPTRSRADRIAALDLLRGLAALAVMIPHFLMYAGGQTGAPEIASATAVEVFFVLSGFVLGPQVILCLSRGDLRTYRIFLMRRWMRTVPSYLVALLCVAVIFHQVGSADFYRYAGYVGNFFRQHNASNFYPVAWSLAVEEWYYVTFPIFLLVGARIIRRKDDNACLMLAIGFVLSIALIRAIFVDAAGWGEQVRRVVVFRIDSIAYGFLLFLILRRMGMAQINRFWAAAIFALAALATALVNLAVVQDAHRIAKDIHPFVAAAFGCSAIVLFILINRFGPWMERLAAYLGHISYPVYLFHLLVLYLLTPFLTGLHFGAQLALYCACTIGLATAFHYIFEKPILASRPHY